MARLETKKKLLLVVPSMLGYALLFVLLCPVLGGATAALSGLPIALSGWFFGFRTGALVGLLALHYDLLCVMLFLSDAPSCQSRCRRKQ